MLKIMRKNSASQKAILVLVILALASYVLVSFGDAPPKAQDDTLAKVGSTKIKVRDAQIQRENIRNSFARLDPQTMDQFAVSGLMTNAILMDGAKKSGISVSDIELRDYVINYRTDSDGTFISDEQWARFIQARFRLQVESFEEYLREHALSSNKYRRLFLDSTYVSEERIKERFLENNQQLQLEMLVVNVNDVKSEVSLNDDKKLKKFYENHKDRFLTGDLRQVEFVSLPVKDLQDSIEVGDADIEAYYNENSERYKIQEQVKANHVLIKTEGQSEEDALAIAKNVKKQIDEGLDFAEAAKKYSGDDSNKDRGGSLGFFGRGRMLKPFENAAFSMKVGEISDPLLVITLSRN